jgi:hypothetical protein
VTITRKEAHANSREADRDLDEIGIDKEAMEKYASSTKTVGRNRQPARTLLAEERTSSLRAPHQGENTLAKLKLTVCVVCFAISPVATVFHTQRCSTLRKTISQSVPKTTKVHRGTA